MKRFHVHLGVPDLAASVRFYSGLFGAPPTVHKDDYAEWMLDEPRVNFAISQRTAGRKGLNHLGLQAESASELAELQARFDAADEASAVAESDVSCCYARSNKHWVTDPQGIAWEAFHTLESVPMYDGTACGDATAGCGAPASEAVATGQASPCCGPASERNAARPCCS